MAVVLGGNCPGGSYPSWQLSGDSCPRWQLSGGSCLRWQLSRWQLIYSYNRFTYRPEYPSVDDIVPEIDFIAHMVILL